MASIGNAGNTRIVGANDLQRSIDSLDRVIQGLNTVVSRLPSGVTSVLSGINTANRTAKGARNIVQDIFQGPQSNGRGGPSHYRYNWGNVGGNITFGGGQNHSVTQAYNRVAGGMNSGGYILSTPGAGGTPIPSMSSGTPNGGGARFSGVGAGGTANPGGPQGGPPIDLSGITAGAGAVGKVNDFFKGMMTYMIGSGTGSDWAIRRQMMMTGNSYKTTSANSFGGSNGLGGFNGVATSSDDVAAAMMTAQNVSGSNIGNRQSPYNQFTRGAAGVAYGNPTIGAAQAAQYTASMYAPRSVMMSAAYGMPTIGMNGQRATPGQQASMLLQRTGLSGASQTQLDTALRTGYGLDASINTLSQATGQDPDLMRQQIRSQSAIANKNKISMEAAGGVLEKASQGDKAAISQARKAGVGTSVLQSLKTADAASRKTDQQIMESFSQALIGATDFLNKFTSGINAFLEKTHLDTLIGGASAIGGAIGSGTSGMFGPIGVLMGAMGNGMQSTPGTVGGEAGSGSASQTTKPATKGPTPGSGSTAQNFINAAKKYIGQPYVFGGLDCSGLVMYAYKAVTGKSLPHRATSQYYMGQQVPKGKEQPGDTVYWDASTGRAPGNPSSGKGYKHHTAIYLGGGKILAAPQTGENVKIQNLWGDYEFARLPGIGGAVSGNMNSAATSKDTTQTNQGGDTGAGQAAAIGSLGDVYGSTSEYDALAAALAGAGGGNGDQPTSTTKTSQTASPVGSSTGDSGGAPTAAMSADAGKASLQAMVKKMAAAKGWSSATDWNDINYIVEHESSWNPKSVNSIGAYGLFQAYPGSKMAKYGSDWKTNPVTQTKFGLDYIKSRYGDPVKAQAFWAKNRWYDNGAWEIPSTQNALLHKGEMVLDKTSAETVRQALVRNNTPSASGGSGGGVTIVFDKGAICVNNAAAVMNDENIRNLAREIAQQTSEDVRIKQIAKGN